jgi:hypothetical protein
MPRENAGGGVTAEQLVSTSWNVLNLTLYAGQKDWPGMGEDFQEAFVAAVQRLAGMIEEAEGGSIKGTAREGYTLFQQAQGSEFFTPWEELPEKDRLSWEAVVRHMVNVLGGFDPEEDGGFEEHETYWPSWLQHQLALKGQTEEQRQIAREQAQGGGD